MRVLVTTNLSSVLASDGEIIVASSSHSVESAVAMVCFIAGGLVMVRQSSRMVGKKAASTIVDHTAISIPVTPSAASGGNGMISLTTVNTMVEKYPRIIHRRC